MLDPQATRFWQSTLMSGLMDARGLAACWQALPPEKRTAPEHIDRRLARQAVHAKALTLWQAQQLLAGRTTGFKVDRYVLLDLIGQGGMGRVYLAQDSRLNRRVALKILAPERVNNPRAIARFQREARVGAQLQHEHLVRIYDFGESNGRYFLVMEYIEGKTIGTLISEGGAMPPVAAVRLVRQVALGLEHAHRKGLIHRDVNPYNILVTRDGTAKLADLGLAIDLAEEDRVTREGATVGTFDYVAPEQARHSHSADIRSDIYSLGCTLYHMCAGQVPFPTPSLPEKLFAHQAMEPEPLDKMVPGIPEGLAAVVQRMMHKSPDERYTTPLQVAQVLEAFCEDPAGSSADQALIGESAKTEAEASKAPMPTDGAKTGASRGKGDESPAVPTSAMTPSHTLKTPQGIESRSGAGELSTGAGSSPVSPAGSSPLSDPDFPLGVDLGPEPSLGEALSRPKSRSVSNYPIAPDRRRAPLPALPRNWLWGLAAFTTAVMILVVVLAMMTPDGASGQAANQSLVGGDRKNGARVKSEETVGQDDQEKFPIVVRSESEIEKEFPADKLRDAIDTAIGHGWVELRNRKPLRLTTDQAIDLNSSRGKLTIRAAPGVEPVIEIELKTAKPFLMTGSSVNVKLCGVTFLVYYPDSKATGAPPPPPLITAAGRAEFDRCAFNTMDTHVKASCAVFSSGGVLEINHCWFEGFDKAIEVDADNKSHTIVRQTMIVPEPPKEAARGPIADSFGWGLKLRFAGDERGHAANLPAHLTLDHCTVEGGGLLDLSTWKGPGSVETEVKQCVVRTEALLAVVPKEPPAKQVFWHGEANVYDIQGRYWIVLSASMGTPAFSNEVMDLPGWSGVFAHDTKPIAGKVKYQIDPTARPKSLKPSDFAIEAGGAPQTCPGADPSQVGPASVPAGQPAVTLKDK
jgi:serine/threonine-protein kinase